MVAETIVDTRRLYIHSLSHYHRYRKVDGAFVVDSEFQAEDGSYLFPNITEAHMAYASGDGVEYYCTATNDFGTIRSRTVKAFYAGKCIESLIPTFDNRAALFVYIHRFQGVCKGRSSCS